MLVLFCFCRGVGVGEIKEMLEVSQISVSLNQVILLETTVHLPGRKSRLVMG